MQALQCRLDPLRLALHEAGSGEGQAGQPIGAAGSGLGPAAEQIQLFLNGEELADLLEERRKFTGGERRVAIPFQAAAALHQLIEQGDTLLAGGHGREIAADQVEHAVRKQGVQLLFQSASLIRQLAHALQQLQALLQGAGCCFVMALAAVVGGGGMAGQAGQKTEIGLAAAAQRRGLGWLQTPAGGVERFQCLAGLQQQQQSTHLTRGRNLEAGHGTDVAVSDGGQLPFVGVAALLIAEQFGTGTQQIGPGLQGVVGEALVGGPIQPLLKGAQHGLAIGGGAHPQQPEMVDRQFHAVAFARAGL